MLQDILGHASIDTIGVYARLTHDEARSRPRGARARRLNLTVRRKILQIDLAEPELVSTMAFIWVFSLARGFAAVWFGFMRLLFFA